MSKRRDDRFRFIDFLIIIFFLSVAAYGVYLFREDLMQTINLQNVKPAGTVVVKKNTVQRRLSDRVLWDRLAYESPVYIGDLIRVADLSAATLHIEKNSIDLEENTLIRITRSPDGEGLQIILNEGKLSLAAGGNIILDIDGRQVHAGPGTALSASTGENGLSVQVTEGSARFIDDGFSREITSGNAISMDENGVERAGKAAVVTRPAANARYLKNTPEPLPVNFTWNRINLTPDETLRLEIAADRNFTRSFRVIENLNNSALADFDSGPWYWRLLFENTVLNEGRFTIADASGPELISPAMNSVFRYQNDFPVMNYQWSEIEEAQFYNLEVCDNPGFINPQIRANSAAAIFADAGLGEGTWYWRVMPVFPFVYDGIAAFSQTAVFTIERGEEFELHELLAEETPQQAETVSQPVPEIVRPQITLVSPANGTRIEGLTALSRQTVFTWNIDTNAARTRFVLSRNSNPLQGRPDVEVNNPVGGVRLDQLREGTWYWTVEARTADGVTTAAAPRRLDVLPIPLLPAPQNMRPERGYEIGVEEIQYQRSIIFAWSQVTGANAYIFTLYHQATNGRRQIIRTTLDNLTVYTLDDLRVLDRGTFIWQVEAISRRGGVIERRGRIGENTFAIEFPSPSPVQIEEPGVLYGN